LRTSDYAQIVIDSLRLEIEARVDPRLNEIDYGKWGGLSDAEVQERFGMDKFEDWTLRSRWPSGAGWRPGEEIVINEVREFFSEIESRHRGETVLVITSNGRLRYFLNLIPGEFERRVASRDFKVKTGNLCEIRSAAGGNELRFWNREPSDGLFT
jgi:probable phosphoglycerate mutase